MQPEQPGQGTAAAGSVSLSNVQYRQSVEENGNLLSFGFPREVVCEQRQPDHDGINLEGDGCQQRSEEEFDASGCASERV